MIHGKIKKPGRMLDASARFSFHSDLNIRIKRRRAHWPGNQNAGAPKQLPARLHSFRGVGPSHRIRQHSALPTITIRRPAAEVTTNCGGLARFHARSFNIRFQIPVGDVAFSNHHLHRVLIQAFDCPVPVTRFEKFPSEPVEHFVNQQPIALVFLPTNKAESLFSGFIDILRSFLDAFMHYQVRFFVESIYLNDSSATFQLNGL